MAPKGVKGAKVVTVDRCVASHQQGTGSLSFKAQSKRAIVKLGFKLNCDATVP